MDINEALAELRAAFQRVGWTATEDEPGSWAIRGGGLMIWNFSAGWMCQDKMAPTPLLAVRAWLAAQPTAAFYPEAPSAALTECHGTLVMRSSGAWAMVGISGSASGLPSTATMAGDLAGDADIHRPDSYVCGVYPVVVRVPVPVEPPVLVGEVVP